jgi:cobalt-precorrin-5B (C1)-methyltransferase
MTLPPRDRKGLRTGFTTGACAAAAARAATRLLMSGGNMSHIETVLPNRQRVTFALHRVEIHDDCALASIIKDAGDDPDCTHGAEIVAKVSWRDEGGVEIIGGSGVARVTKPGLGLELGGPAINPVPRRNIEDMVRCEVGAIDQRGVRVEISVPHGEEMAKKTTNARLGLIGGISILGTTGIVKPYSTAAYKSSVVQAIELAFELGLRTLVLTTGGKSEHYAMELFPSCKPESFIQVGDFVGVGVRHAARKGMHEVRLVAMVGKLSKIGDGVLQTHQAGSQVDVEGLADLAGRHGAAPQLVARIRQANTARHVLELCTEAHFVHLSHVICERAAQTLMNAAQGRLVVGVTLIDFDGATLGHHTILHPDARNDHE